MSSLEQEIQMTLSILNQLGPLYDGGFGIQEIYEVPHMITFPTVIIKFGLGWYQCPCFKWYEQQPIRAHPSYLPPLTTRS